MTVMSSGREDDSNTTMMTRRKKKKKKRRRKRRKRKSWVDLRQFMSGWISGVFLLFFVSFRCPFFVS